ncbi:MAG TPA: endonuclease/exonuclease/phosphatase family protein [Acidimicrobiales bacterium]|jgi:endonuclease/exonuclease/phosphatase family metal-dependent hydrolase
MTPIESRLRVMSWNLWWQFGPWEERLAAIAATLAAVDADVIALQEVWHDGTRNQAAELAAGLGYEHVYASRLDLDGVQFGNAVLARWPITNHETMPLPAPSDADELRLVLRADVDGPRGPIQIFSTHLNWRFDQSHVRQDQVATIARFVDAAPERIYPPVVCGDFNAVPDSDEIRMMTGRMQTPVNKLVFHDSWEAAGDRDAGDGFTWSNDNVFAKEDLEPNRRIDYVFVGWPKSEGAGHVVSSHVLATKPVHGVQPSDHYAVVAELRY